MDGLSAAAVVCVAILEFYSLNLPIIFFEPCLPNPPHVYVTHQKMRFSPDGSAILWARNADRFSEPHHESGAKGPDSFSGILHTRMIKM